MTRTLGLLLLVPALGATGGAAAAEPSDGERLARLVSTLHGHGPELLKRIAAWAGEREFTRMFLAVARGSNMGPGDGWFGPSRSRYDFAWLAARHGKGKAGPVPREVFKGPAEVFARLDKTGDGVLTAADFDWSEKSPFLAKSMPATMLFYMMDRNGNGRITRDEWLAVFERMSQGKDYLSQEDLRLVFQPPPAPKGPKAKKDSGMPSPTVLMAGLLSGELGSPFEGPRPGQRAPDFALKTADGEKEYRLSDNFGKRPTVLIFGSFT